MSTLDRSLLLARRGYLFTGSLDEAERRQLRERSGVEVPFLGRTALLVTGSEGVDLFYDTTRLVRHRAMPGMIARPLFGRGAVHGLDGEEHLRRKAQFLEVLDVPGCERLAALVRQRWAAEVASWGGAPTPVFDAAVRVFGSAVFTWAGIDEGARAEATARRLADIVDGFGAVGPANLRARRARRWADGWAQAQVRDARAGRLGALDDRAPLTLVARFRSPDGRLLDEHTAAAELLNLLRPTIAVAWLATFTAVSLSEHPEWRRRVADSLAEGDEGPALAFAHEVRRFYPFVPLLAARAVTGFTWHGFDVRPGQRVLLDVHGTDHGSEWEDPWAFRPERFLGRDPLDVPHFVPQGGGSPDAGHRCPGEGVATGLLVETLRVLAPLGALEPTSRDLDLPLTRMPTRPRSGFVVRAR